MRDLRKPQIVAPGSTVGSADMACAKVPLAMVPAFRSGAATSASAFAASTRLSSIASRVPGLTSSAGAHHRLSDIVTRPLRLRQVMLCIEHAQTHDVIAKYKGLADVIGRSINASVNVVFIREFSALEDGLKQQRLRPGHGAPQRLPCPCPA